MSAFAWLAKLNLSPEAACRCGHNAHVHHHGKDCTALVDESRMTYCKCSEFREAKSEEEITMAKEKKNSGGAAHKPKGEGRVPTLKPYVDGPLSIYMTTGKKEYKGLVLSSGIIKVDEKEFTSPSSAGSYILGNDKKGKPRQVDGWKSWTFNNKNGERVMLNTLRGGKSPLKLETTKREKKAKAANGKATWTTKRIRKPRTAKPTATAGETQAAAGAA